MPNYFGGTAHDPLSGCKRERLRYAYGVMAKAQYCQRVVQIGLLVSLGFIILACNSLHKNAEILMQGEEYGEAAKVYSQILNQDPNDAKAIVGLKKARTNWIDRKLIDVRMLRLSEQAGPAAELLKQIIEREREWQFYPEGAVQYTQEEETQLAVRFVTAQVEAWRTKGYLLQARAFLQIYHPVFATPALVKRYEAIGGQLAASANEQCLGFKQDLAPSQPYFATFAKRYCDSWGVSVDPGFDIAKVRGAVLFNGIQISGTAETIPKALQTRGQQRLLSAFQRTAWYDSEGAAPLAVQINAAFASDHTKTIEHTVHSYTVQVPYTVMIPQMRTIPHTTYTKSCNAYGCITTPLTTYTYETYMVPITRYREDPRQFPYDRWRHHQLLIFHAEVSASVEGTDAQSVHTQKTDDTDTEHPHSVPEIGLYPDPLTLPDPLQWLERQIDATADEWRQSLGQAWVRRHCATPESTATGSALADYVFRCLREPQRTLPTFINVWFQQRFDAGHEDVEKWLARVDHAPRLTPVEQPVQQLPAERPISLPTQEAQEVPDTGSATRIRRCIEKAESDVSKPADYIARCLNVN